jgi:RNA polymerase sigma factor (sigma-70 family)
VTTNRLTSVLDRIRGALRKEDAETTDGQMLEAFVRGHDVPAMEALVRRHAPMVWGVCRRKLANYDEAEDAFQATFLVLVRKAASIRAPERLASWLYAVAQKTACKARQRAEKRISRERQVLVMPEPTAEPQDDTIGKELRALLDEKLSRLPEKYRGAVVLCDVEAKTRHEAARQLCLPAGTVASRLARGRALLARRLIRRGLAMSAVSLVAALPGQTASAAVPASLLDNTTRAVRSWAAGETAAAGLTSAEVAPLAECVLRALSAAKYWTTGICLVLATLWLVLATLVLAGGPVPLQAPEARPTRPEPVSRAPGEVRRITFEQWAWSVSFSPNGRQVLIGVGGAGEPVRVCEVSSSEEVLRTAGYTNCWSAVYSPDGKFIAVGSGGEPIQVLDAVTGQVCHELQANARRVRNVTFSPDGRLLASSHGDGRLRVWDIAGRQVLHTFPAYNGATRSAAFTPDGEFLLVVGPDSTLRLYEVSSGAEVRRFEGHADQVTDVAISADGRSVLSCSFDKTLRLWDLETGKEVRCLEGHDEHLHGVAFCPDGRRALTGSADKSLRLWDLRTGRQLHRFDGHEGTIHSVAVSPDGRYALTGCSDQTVRLWRLPDPAPAPGK